MARSRAKSTPVAVALATLLGLSCVPGKPLPLELSALGDAGANDGGVLLPEFALADVNANSATHGTLLSLSAFPGDTTAWYFTHST